LQSIDIFDTLLVSNGGLAPLYLNREEVVDMRRRCALALQYAADGSSYYVTVCTGSTSDLAKDRNL
jgi:hypothetical protein